ncbi:hypothetical protein [Streptomyces sp. NPDC057966]|uniref:hypothetical protein n=1 Tax=Streptomyces sp. NPDC057966 TaxID=3346292 RepID=UPI0036E6BD6E
MSACSSGDSSAGKTPKETPTPEAKQPSKSADPTETAKTEAITTYTSYWREMERLYADSNGKKSDLKKYAASGALVSAETDAKNTHARGLIHVGEVSVSNSTVTSLDINRKIPNVMMSSCLDIERWKVINAETKRPAALPTERLTRFVVVTTVERWPEGWRVIRDEPQDKAC